MIIINNYDEMKEYYNEETNTYTFNDNVMFTFDLILEANIQAFDINAQDITAYDIDAWDIKAWVIDAKNIDVDNIIARDIIAHNISYWGVCFAEIGIICNSIVARTLKGEYFSLYGKVIVNGLELDD